MLNVNVLLIFVTVCVLSTKSCRSSCGFGSAYSLNLVFIEENMHNSS